MAINLNKITLEKQGDTHKIDLTKRSDSISNEIVINLNWHQEELGNWSKFWKSNKSIDLDLGCWYELRDGSKSCIDGLQFAHGQGGSKNQPTRQGCYSQKPWIWHSGDDRAGSASEGEKILINSDGIVDLKRITIYCFIYDGVAKWDDTDAIVTIKVPNNTDIIVEMGNQYSSQKFCAIAEIVFEEDNSMTVKKLVTFHNGHNDCNKAYDWGMQFRAGSK